MKHKKDKSKMNVIAYLKEMCGNRVGGLGHMNWHSSEFLVLYNFEFWNYGNVLYKQKVKNNNNKTNKDEKGSPNWNINETKYI